MFVEAFKQVGGLWIMKPVGRCQGRGIFMLDRVGQAAAWKKSNDEREADKKEIYVVSKCVLPSDSVPTGISISSP